MATEEAVIQNMDHLGLVAGMIDELKDIVIELSSHRYE